MPEPFQLIGIAHAQEAGAAAGGGGAAFLTSMMPIILIFALFYLLLIRPQQKRQKQHRLTLEALKKGDKVVTNGGILGTVAAANKEVLTVQVADNVRLRVLRSEIMGLQEEAGADAAKGSAQGKEK